MTFPLDIFFGGFVTGAGVALGISILAGLLLKRAQAAPKPKPRKRLDINRLILGPKEYPKEERCCECGQEIDPHTCHCGEGIEHHSADHMAIPRGCMCYRRPGMRLQPIKPESHLARQVGSLGERGEA